MLDNSPWFRRWMGFSFLPINWQGWATTGAFVLLEALLIRIQDEAGSLFWWLLAAIGFAMFLGFWGLCLWKTDAS
jgi:hypothetical protein